MATLELRCRVKAPRSAAWEFLVHAETLQRLTPPGDDVRIVTPAAVKEGARVELSVRAAPLPLRLKWVSEVRNVEEGHRWEDVAVQSPFPAWVHAHALLDDGTGCVVVDTVTWSSPGGALGDLVANPFIRRMVGQQLAFRHRALLEALGG